MRSPAAHPAALLPAYRQMLFRLAVMSIAGALWACTVFYFSVRPPGWLVNFFGLSSATPFVPGVLYSWYACMHSFYVGLGVALSHSLVSRGWLRAAACGAMLPGPGALFGLVQLVPAFRIFRALARTEWKIFFEWRHRANPVNDLTKKRGGKLLPF